MPVVWNLGGSDNGNRASWSSGRMSLRRTRAVFILTPVIRGLTTVRAPRSTILVRPSGTRPRSYTNYWPSLNADNLIASHLHSSHGFQPAAGVARAQLG